eukprot:CAMPEP_0119377984 /NCGR_PEP_ID=MMETSP1334-20130426/47335_1 /TAXON_ID=127549 /ORGANISM="Calcidiscus leptoporus, Strain RCC1130" /LENGTH=100 /DNA_ID=CAMNT_0007397075 /DNA_START=447 /DNA_END=749 /DNA_ORIENTATION=-
MSGTPTMSEKTNAAKNSPQRSTCFDPDSRKPSPRARAITTSGMGIKRYASTRSIGHQLLYSAHERICINKAPETSAASSSRCQTSISASAQSSFWHARLQ